MFCRQCGNRLSQKKTEFCPACGFRPLNGSNYCQHCGKETKNNQEMCIGCGKLLINLGNFQYAGFWIRFVAVVIDSIIIAIPMLIFWVILLIIGSATYVYNYDFKEWLDISEGLTYLLGALIAFIYYPAMHASKWQATIGKRLVGIKVVSEDGSRISFLRGVWRYAATYISAFILYIGYIIAAFTPKKQSLHDMMAKTFVVKST